MGLTLDAPTLKRMFPKCSEGFLALNANGVSHAEPKRKPKETLDRGVSGEKESAHRTYVRIVRFARKSLDRDNLYAGAKACIDCLKESGLIVDDSEKHICLVVDQERVDNECEQRTEIEIVWP